MPGQIVLYDEPFKAWQYAQPLDFDLVKVVIRQQATRMDAVQFQFDEVTGRIGRLEIDTWNADGIKIGKVAHDLLVESGYVRCHDRRGTVHQDGIHAMGGYRITFLDFEDKAFSSNHSALFINVDVDKVPDPADWPTDIVCDHCLLQTHPGVEANNTVHIGHCVRSGARNSQVYDDQFRTGLGEGIDIVNVGNTFYPVPPTTWDPPCQDSCPTVFDGSTPSSTPR